MRSETHLKSIAICAAIVLLGSGYAVAGTLTTLCYGTAPHTQANGISGNSVVGYSLSAGVPSNFVYNIDTGIYTALDFGSAIGVKASGISGDNVVGVMNTDSGFIYNVPEPTTLLLLGLGAAVLRKRT